MFRERAAGSILSDGKRQLKNSETVKDIFKTKSTGQIISFLVIVYWKTINLKEEERKLKYV